MLVEVEILGCVMTAQHGTLATGDILRTSAEFAAHLVDDCGAAKYTKAKPPVVDNDSAGVTLAWANTPDGKHVLLGEMTKEELQALAKQYGVEAHRKSGVDKLIEALQTAFAHK